MRPLLTLLALLLLLPATAWAHKASDSYLHLDLRGETVEGRWDLALRDLELAVGLDADGDGALTWGEVRGREEAIAAHALARLEVTLGGRPCPLRAGELLIDHHSDGAYAVLPLRSDCSLKGAAAESLGVDYRFLFDLDPLHRGLLSLSTARGAETAVLSPDSPRLERGGEGRGAWHQLVEYWREGVWHIWIGFDHLLFLFALLLPAVLRREEGGWVQAGSFRTVCVEVVTIVTAFTVAHSLTLAVAVLGWVQLPGRWVEVAIAATVVLAALGNLVRLPAALGGHGRRWPLALVLGLIHGFGFANVLQDLGLPPGALARSLLGFNLGVETGQLALVALFLPLAFLLRGSWFYRRVALGAGSVAVALIGMAWLLDRSFQLGWMAF